MEVERKKWLINWDYGYKESEVLERIWYLSYDFKVSYIKKVKKENEREEKGKGYFW